MRILSSVLLVPLAACSLTVAPANQAQANTAAPANYTASANVSEALTQNQLATLQRDRAANVPAANSATGDYASDETGGRELPAEAANLDFVALNRTGQNVRALAISPAGEESWIDLLGTRTIPDRERAALSYTRDYEMCEWDVRVTFENGTRRSWPRVNLCDTVRVELR